MSLEIIPAIDLMGGQAVRLRQGDYATAAKVALDPIAVAQEFAAQGVTRLHIVDLEASRDGVAHNYETIKAIIQSVPRLAVQVGGGVRTAAAAELLLDAGATRVIVGTSASQDETAMREILARYGAYVIVGADSIDGFVAVRGWQEKTAESTADFGWRLVGMGAQRFLFTDVGRDGMLEGPNIPATIALAKAVGVPVLASGGVSGPDDISRLAEAHAEGIEGVIIGKALYAGRLTLADALSRAATNGTV